MSRRKQAKPQHLRSDQTRLFPELLAISDEEPDDSDSGNESRSGSEEIHVCEKCCAEFFKWSDFCEHMEICTKNPLVIIVKDNESVSATQDTQDYFSESSPIPSCISGLEESGTAGPDGQQTSDETSSSVVEQIALSDQKDGHMEVDLSPKNALLLAESVIRLSQLEEAEQYSDDRNGMPSTNVTLETLQGTRVAVAQFSQSSGTLVSEVSAISISLILDRLMALQHQQIHQLKLIEQILTQVSLIHRQLLSQPDGDEAMKMSLLVTSSSSSGTSVAGPLQLKSFITAPERQIPVKGPSNPIDRDPKSTSTALEPPHSTILQVEEGNHDATNSIPSSIGNPCFTADTCASGETGLDDALGCGVPSTRSPPSPLAPTRGRLLPPSSTLPLLPQTFPSSVIFPNPIASIAATTDALDPISTLMKHCKGKVPTLSALETKPSSEDPFFKHKCRFCAKVFGSDSALQIHLRSHTGERPFKCNICGNRFSTKGNLKVHFQRHKEKYPHIQMNPYPVPEYLDNVPTTTGIPYGMSLLPEKPMTPWLNSKPALSTFSTSTAPLLPSTIHRLMTNYGDSASLSPLHRSPQRQTSPTHGSSPVYPNQASASVGKSSPQSNGKSSSIKTETIYLPANCKSKSLDPCAFPSLASPNPVPTLPEVPDPVTPASSASEMNVQSESQSKCSFGDLLDSMQTSETTKLQKLVENIDKRMRDPNHCAICHRVLSCQSALKMHYRIHTGERPFKCKICGRAFTTKGNLKTHFGVHRSKPPLRIQHSCPICQKKFTNAVVLQQHIRMHMGGHIPNTPMPEAFQHMDRKFPFDDKCSNKTERFNDDEVEDMEQEMKDEEEVDLLQQQNSPLASAISGIISMTKELQDVGLTISATHSLNTKPCQNGRESEGEIGDMVRVDTPGDLGSSVGQDPQVTGSLAQSGCSSSVEGSPSQDQTKGHHAKSPTQGHYNQKDDLQNAMELNRTVKCEQLNTPPEVDLTATQTTWPLVKEEDAISFLFPGRDRSSHTGPKISSTYSAESNIGRGEINGHSKPALFCEGSHLLSGPIARPQSSGSPSLTPALGPPPPPRRTPKQHNCHLCGKNFSSASALQIHERTHTGEKPFGCSICGRAFTTKGNLKVHMGTHMWNNTPARRGRRLSLENPLPLLGGDAVKFSELLHKERQTPTISIDTAVWSRYAAAVRSGMAARNNEISVIQNRSAPATESDAEGMSGGKKPPCNGLAKTRVELGTGHSFSRLLEQSNRIGID